MADPVDRVFDHALNMVQRMPVSGGVRPPTTVRLRLYGLYKQSMEGDVMPSADRRTEPRGSSDVEQQKWDQWSSQRGLSRTEAKRRYVSLLIETMQIYGSSSPDGRELILELVCMWELIRSIDPSTTSSPTHVPPTSDVPASSGTGLPSNDSAMLMLSPNSEQDREEDDENEDNEDEHYEDAQQGEDIDDRAIDERGDRDRSTDMTSLQKANAQTPRRWRRRVEDALARLTVEVSALREQSRTEYDQRDSGNITIPRRLLWIFSIGTSGRRRGASIWKWVVGRIWALLRHVVIDLVLVGLLYAWMRRRRDERSQMITGIVKGIIMEQGRRLQARLGRQQQR